MAKLSNVALVTPESSGTIAVNSSIFLAPCGAGVWVSEACRFNPPELLPLPSLLALPRPDRFVLMLVFVNMFAPPLLALVTLVLVTLALALVRLVLVRLVLVRLALVTLALMALALVTLALVSVLLFVAGGVT